MTGEYDGVPFQGAVNAVNTAIVYPGTRRVSAGDIRIGPNDVLSVTISLGSESWGTPPPQAFTIAAPPTPDLAVGRLQLEWEARNFSTDPPPSYTDTPNLTWRAAGITAIVSGNPNSPSQKTSEIAKGTLAASVEPDPGCTPDGSTSACARVRLRGNFNVRALLNWNLAVP